MTNAKQTWNERVKQFRNLQLCIQTSVPKPPAFQNASYTREAALELPGTALHSHPWAHTLSQNILPEHGTQLSRQYGRQSLKDSYFICYHSQTGKKNTIKNCTPTTKFHPNFAQLLPGHASAFTDCQWHAVPWVYNGKTYSARQSPAPHLDNVSLPRMQCYIIKTFSLESWS